MKKSRLSYAFFGLSFLIGTWSTSVEASPYRGTCQFLLTVVALSQVVFTEKMPEQDALFPSLHDEQLLQVSPAIQEFSYEPELQLSFPQIKEVTQKKAVITFRPISDSEEKNTERRGLQSTNDVVCDCHCGTNILDIIALVILIQIHITAGCILQKVKRDYAIPIEAAPNGNPATEDIIDNGPNIVNITE